MTSGFDQRIRAARPVSGHRALPLSDRAKCELAALLLTDPEELDELDGDWPDEPDSTAAPMAPDTPAGPAGTPDDRRHPPARSDSTRPRGRRDLSRTRERGGRGLRRRWGWLVSAVVLLAATLFGATVARPAQVWAATPPLLAVAPIAGTASDLLNQLADAAAASGDPVPTGDIHIAMQEWALDMEYDADIGDISPAATVVVPQRILSDRYADGSVTIVFTAGRPMAGSENAAPSANTPPEGTELSRVEYKPGEFPPAFPEPFPTEASGVAPFAAQYFGPETPPDADQMVSDLVPSLLTEQVLSGAQRATLFRYLASLSGIESVGSVTDRLGRPGILFATSNAGDPDWTDYLVVAPDTGRILAVETHYSGHDRPDLRSPSVTSYTAWE